MLDDVARVRLELRLLDVVQFAVTTILLQLLVAISTLLLTQLVLTTDIKIFSLDVLRRLEQQKPLRPSLGFTKEHAAGRVTSFLRHYVEVSK